MKTVALGFAIVALLAASPAMAAETSNLEVAGFNKDGSVFVFEEYGVADGAGLPYASVFALDVAEDAWLPGSPAHIRVEEGELVLDGGDDDYEQALQAALLETRNRARAKADPFLLDVGRLGYGTARVQNTPWEIGNPALSARFTIRDLLPHDDKAWALTLEQTPFPASDACFSMVEEMQGYRLTLTDEQSGVSRILNEDDRIPGSRGCPLRYRIEAVHTHDLAEGRTAMAVLLRYYKPGFEGPDGRMLAVTTVIEPSAQ